MKKSDKKAITNVLCKRSSQQRLEIAAAYKLSFKKALVDDFKSKLSGNVKNIYIALLLSVPEFYCIQLRKNKSDGIVEGFAKVVLNLSTDISPLFFDGESGDESVIIEIMCTMSNNEIRRICATYQQMFGKRLEQGIQEDQNGNFKKLLVILIAGQRDESTDVDLKKAKSQAEQLNKHFSKTITEEKQILEMLCTESFSQIAMINSEYQKLTGSALEKTVKKNISDNLKDALIAIIRTSNNVSEYYARRINKAINNHLLDNRTLHRLIIARSEVDLMDVKEEFTRLFRKTIKSCLKDEISGSYKYALMTLLDEQ